MSVFEIAQDFFDNLEQSNQEAMEQAAEACIPAAQQFAPVDTGAYQGSFYVGEMPDGRIALGNKDWKSWLIEVGTEDTPVFAPLRKAVESRGYTIGPDREAHR